LLSDFEKKNCAIVGCSNDPVPKNAAFAAEQGFSYPLLCDTDLAVAIAYGAADDSSAKSASRIAALINEQGAIEAYYSPAGKAEFPPKVLAAL
jgi:peroxiredoxin